MLGGYTFLGPNRLQQIQAVLQGLAPGAPPNTPKLELTKVGPSKVLRNQQYFYTLTVTNTGTAEAKNVQVQDELPPLTQAMFIRHQRTHPGPLPGPPGPPANCTLFATLLNCNLGDIPAKQSRRVFIVVQALSILNVKVTNTARLGAQKVTHTLEVKESADVYVTKRREGGVGFHVATGAIVTYTVTIGNNGDDTATGVVVTDTLPASRDQTLEVDNPRLICTRKVPGIECKVASLSKGERMKITIRLRLVGEGGRSNKVNIKAEQHDPKPANNNAQVDIAVSGQFADIIGSIHQVALDSRGPQPKAEVAAAALNAGVSFAPASQLLLDLPHFAMAQALPPFDTLCSRVGASNDLLCNLGLLARGERKEVRFMVTSPPNVDYFAEVRAGSAAPDPDLTNNRNQAQIEVSGPQPGHSVGAMSNSAKVNLQVLSPGSDPAVFGSGFASELTVAPAGRELPVELAGVQVLLNDIPAPLFFVAPTQINFQTPWELLGADEALLRVVANNRESYAQQVLINLYDPGIFTANQRGTGQGSILIAGTTSLAAPEGFVPGSRPVRRGEFLSIYCNGLGPVDDPPPSGVPTPSDRLYETTERPTVTIGGIQARVVFAGLSPGFVGLYQVNVEVSAEAPVGDAVPLVLTIGDEASNEVTVAIAEQ